MSDANVSTVGSQQNLVPVSSRKARLKKRTRLEIRLLIIIGVLVFLLVIFIAVVIILSCENKTDPKRLQETNSNNEACMMEAGNQTSMPSCNSGTCIASAYSLMESLDRRVDPCEDFYLFACGNWGRGHPVKDSDTSNTWFAERSQFLVRRLKDLLGENSTSMEPRTVRLTKSFFGACQDLDTLEQKGLVPIMVVLDNVSLPTELPNAKTSENWDIATSLALAQRVISLDSLVQLGPDVDSLESGKLILNFSPPRELTPLIRTLVTDPEDMPKAIRLTSEDIVKARLAYMMGIIEEMDSWGKSADDDSLLNATSIASFAIKILLFSGRVSQGISGDEDNSTVTTVRMTVPGLQRVMDASVRGAKNDHKIDWEKYINVLLEDVEKPFDMEKDIISVTDITYFQNLAWVLSNAKLETIQRYVWWQVVEVLALHTNKAMRNLRNQLLEQLFGSLESPSRSSLCLRRVKKLLPMAVSYTLASQEDVANTIAKVSEMMDDIKSSFNSLVNDEDWINQETKKAAQEKANAITSFIGYQDWILQPGKLDQYYSSLDLVENEYLYNILRIKSREVEDFLQLIIEGSGSEKNKSWNDIDPLQVNAYYSRTENAIIIPAGILQFPFYDRGLEALNYGSIGSILGHELTHGFDIEGKNYGKDGTKVSWWNEEMLKAYEDRAQCFIQQYDEFGTKENKVNGRRTLAENIADNGGIREAYRAYQKYKERHEPEPYLPGLEEFSHDQLLFLAFANMWCLDEGRDYQEISVKDSHSPGKYRVLGSLSNSPEFAEAWHCSENSSMNPTDRCIIW